MKQNKYNQQHSWSDLYTYYDIFVLNYAEISRLQQLLDERDFDDDLYEDDSDESDFEDNHVTSAFQFQPIMMGGCTIS